MSLITFWNERIKRMDWSDIGLIKLAVAGFVLMLAKLWTPLLSLAWYWYFLIFIIAAIKPLHVAYFKKV
jgi:hypothetical protein